MQYPKLKELNIGRQMVDTFKGYNHNLRISEGEFFEMENLTSDYYPVLAPRKGRGVYREPKCYPFGLIAKDKLCYLDGKEFVVGDERVDMGLSYYLNEEKQLISMGDYVIVMPDQKYINTQTLEWGSMGARYYRDKGAVTFRNCLINGEYIDYISGASAPKSPANGTYWLDTSAEPYALKRYAETSRAWSVVSPTYMRIDAEGIGADFSRYDGVVVHDLPLYEWYDQQTWDGLIGSKIIQACENDYIVIEWPAIETMEYTEDYFNAVEIAREIPRMDFAVEYGNRLWGCRYGENRNGDLVNEIYASKLGDFKNWNVFQGVSTDSYAASVGTDGPFTGAISYLGYPMFFKENCVHKVYGDYPANFQIQATDCRGVQEGCGKSLAIVNETLLYKSRGGVCAYDGSLPVEVSYALGHESYSNAVAGGHRGKYYISMEDREGLWHLFVYDVAKGVWHREDDFRALGFASWKDDLYAIEAQTVQEILGPDYVFESWDDLLVDLESGEKKIVTMLGSGEKDEGSVKWMAQTGPIGTDMPDMKYVSKLTVRMTVPLGAVVRIYAEYDSIGGWRHLCTITGKTLRSFSIPIRPRRCDHLRLRFEGEGDVRIYSIAKTIEQGSDVS